MKIAVLVFSLALSVMAHAETPAERAEAHLGLAKGFAHVLARAQEPRLSKEVVSRAKAQQNLEMETQATENLKVMRGLLARDFTNVGNEIELKKRIGNVIRTIDTILSGRDGVSAANSTSSSGKSLR